MANSDRISSEYTTVYFWCVWGDIHTAGRSGPGPESGSGRPATFWTIEPDRVCLRGSEAISVIVQNVYNVAGRDRISSLNNNTWPCNYLEDFVWDWPYHPKFVTDMPSFWSCPPSSYALMCRSGLLLCKLSQSKTYYQTYVSTPTSVHSGT